MIGLQGIGFEPNADYSDDPAYALYDVPIDICRTDDCDYFRKLCGANALSGLYSFSVLWAVFVYSPVAHWVWGGGWLDELGAIDFAGGNVVHISSGVAGLVVAIVLGKRKNISDTAPHNLLLTLLGATLIWFGWFGFNVGSALTIDEVAMTAFINTNTAAAAGLIGWILAEWLINKKPTMLGAVSGAIAGLVAITPGAGFVTPFSSVWIGLIGGIVCFWGVFSLKKKIRLR